MRFVLIGGGEIRRNETLPIDRRIAEITGKSRPVALFVPTATGDLESYVETFKRLYGERLGCEVHVLRLLSDPPSQREIEQQILGSDLVYVGGGSTLRMMRIWRKRGVDKVLRKVASLNSNIVFAGLSAGAICWFESGFGDMRRNRFSDTQEEYIRVKGLNIIQGMFCPHYHAWNLEEPLRRKLLDVGGMSIACDDGTAIEIVNGGYRLLSSKGKPRAYRLHLSEGEVVRQPLLSGDGYAPVENLTKIGGTGK